METLVQYCAAIALISGTLMIVVFAVAAIWFVASTIWELWRD